MKKASWRRKIKQACQEAGTYKPFFDSIIDTLSSIMEQRDEAVEQYNKLGGIPVVKHTNKGGATNIVKNPALVIVDDFNKTALTYWRDLGLTPSGLKRINESAMKEKKGGGLESLLADL